MTEGRSKVKVNFKTIMILKRGAIRYDRRFSETIGVLWIECGTNEWFNDRPCRYGLIICFAESAIKLVVFVETVTLNLEDFNGYLVAFVHVCLFLAVRSTRSVFKDEMDKRHAQWDDSNGTNWDFSKWWLQNCLWTKTTLAVKKLVLDNTSADWEHRQTQLTQHNLL